MRLRRLLSLRAFAAILAVTAVLVRPVQTLLACPMQTVVVDEHAHHGDAPTEQAPTHEVCPDLAHCSIAAPVIAVELAAALPPAPLRVLTVHDRPASALPTLDPPPPKVS